MKAKKLSRILLVGCPSEKELELSSWSAKRGFAPMFINDINLGIELIRLSKTRMDKFVRVVSVSHTFANGDIRLASELARECKEAEIPCVVFANIIGVKSIILDMLVAAKRAGASKIFHHCDWQLGISCPC